MRGPGRGLQVLSTFVILVLASGCIASESSAPPTQEAEPAEFDDNTGAIEGRVLNEEAAPIGGAAAQVQETQTTTVADETGAFTFSNLAPGEYTLFVQSLGYESIARRVTVATGQVTPVNFLLTRVAVESPYSEVIVEQGNLQCSVRAYPGVPTTGAAGAPQWTTGVALCGVAPIPGLAEDRFLIIYEIPKGVVEMYVEMEWVSTQAAGSALSFVVEHDGAPNDLDQTFGRDEGRSPLAIYANESIMAAVAETSGKDCFEDDCALMTRVFAEAETTGLSAPIGPFPEPIGDPKDRVDAGLTFDQRFTQYFTHFHNTVMPEGYSALADS